MCAAFPSVWTERTPLPTTPFEAFPAHLTSAVRGLRNLKELGMSVQINMTIARHNAHQLPAVLDMARSLGADALHTFLLVPVGCGVDIAEDQMIPAAEYEKILNWFYDQAQQGGIELKATCAPHYFRVMRQRRAAERRAATTALPTQGGNGREIGPTEMTMPGTTGIALHPHANGHPGAARADSMQAMTKGCLAGTGVCFISYQGDVYPCGYLPVLAGSLHRQTLEEIWENAPVFQQLRDTDNLKGKCGYCEFRNVCMGCRARAFAATGDCMDEEPFCAYQPQRRPRVDQEREASHVSVH